MKIQPSQRTELVQEYYFSHKLRQIDEMRKPGPISSTWVSAAPTCPLPLL
ncbi:MAG: hypothetical protein U0Z17_07220 [Bacteroidales bacterium]